MRLRHVLAVVAAGGLSFGAAFATVSAAAAPAQAQTTRFDLHASDTVVAGGGAGAEAWVLARDGDSDVLVLYGIEAGGALRRSALPLKSAGILAAIAVAPDVVWVGAADTVVRIETRTGRATKVIRLDAPAAVVPSAQRAPDGTVLGWGQITSMAVDDTSAVWVARYAVPALTRIDGTSLLPSVVPLPESTDPDRLVSTSVGVWFTTNFGASDQLGARVGRIDSHTRAVQLLPVVAAAVVFSRGAIEALGAARNSIDPTNLRVTKGTMPRDTVSLASVASDTSGNLIARVAKINRLLIFDAKGRVIRTIDYEAGSFRSRGPEMAVVAPLAMLFTAVDGAIWFAPRGGRSVYRAP